MYWNDVAMVTVYEVHVPAWVNDSHAGTYDTLQEATEQANKLRDIPHYNEKRKVIVYKETTIQLPFGWKLSKGVRIDV